MSYSFLLSSQMQILPRRLGVHCRSPVGDRASFCSGFRPGKMVVTGILGRKPATATTLAARYGVGWLGRVPEYVLSCCATHPSTGRVGDPSQEQFANEVSDSESTIRILGLGMRKRWDTKDVSIYEAPERASWLDVRSEKIFRDETVLYGSKTWEHDGQVELHVWPRGWQTFVFAQLGTGESVP